MFPQYDLDKIKFATDAPTFERAVGLYEGGKVTQFEKDAWGCSAIVIGTSPYHVSVSARQYDHGSCDCYLGQNDTLCKHMVALAIYAMKEGQKLTEEDKKQVVSPQCSGRIGALEKGQLKVVGAEITATMRYIKPYNGPSRIWFFYQNSLSEGCGRLAKIVSDLPVNKQTAGLLVDLLLRLDKKLCTGGVDDSDGAVGGFIEETVGVLEEYVKIDPACAKAFNKLKDRETCFGWEEPLLEFVKN
jgi:hypothetical protein